MELRIFESSSTMIDKIGTDRIPGMADQSAAKQPEAAKPSAGYPADASLHVDYAALVEKALQTPETKPSAVEQARELLLSGGLDTLDSAREAAKNILSEAAKKVWDIPEFEKDLDKMGLTVFRLDGPAYAQHVKNMQKNSAKALKIINDRKK